MGRSSFIYGPLAKFYERFMSPRYKAALERFFREFYLGSGKLRILDAGCGTGIISFALSDKSKEISVVAFDQSCDMLKVAEKTKKTRRELDLLYRRVKSSGEYKRNYHVEFYLGNIESPSSLESLDGRVLNLEENSFDYVVVSGALEHVDLDKGVSELVKYVRKEGSLIDLGVRNNFFGKRLGNAYGFKPYSKEDIVDAFEKAGLATIREIPIKEKRLARFRIAIKGIKV